MTCALYTCLLGIEIHADYLVWRVTQHLSEVVIVFIASKIFDDFLSFSSLHMAGVWGWPPDADNTLLLFQYGKIKVVCMHENKFWLYY